MSKPDSVRIHFPFIKYLVLMAFVCTHLSGYGQTDNSLSELLWSRVKACYSMFEDVDEDGVVDFDKIDDSKNGYLMISGGWPTCGCSCSSTVGAYKNQQGKYIVLQSDKVVCNWEKSVSSNYDLKTLLPLSFGIGNFMSEPHTEKVKSPIFFVDFVIPRVGTDTKVTLELIPFGLTADGSEPVCFGYNERKGYSRMLFRIKDIIAESKDVKTLDYLLSGEFNKITPTDNKVIMDQIGDDDSRFKSKEEIQKHLRELKQMYTIYSLLETTELTLGWNRQESRFFIKEKGEKLERISFKDFLIKNEYWSPMC